ncbi:MAG TPA: ACT domain-containing protein, partial [Rhodothermales bacterium]|nr:ACT domain-containing protein [Rhodothermales bacterium]
MPEQPTLDLTILPGDLAICRLPASAPVPNWAMRGDCYTVTRTQDELSIVCAQQFVPEGAKQEAGWACLKVQGPLDFGLTGILASLVNPLAEAGISVFAISTFDTDYLLVKRATLAQALDALSEAGHRIQ